MSSLIYKPQPEVVTECAISQSDGKIHLHFSSDCGKHGTWELLDEYHLTPKRLLEILQAYGNYKEDEL